MFFWGNFLQFGDKKRAGKSNKGAFWKLVENICHILRKKKVAKFI